VAATCIRRGAKLGKVKAVHRVPQIHPEGRGNINVLKAAIFFPVVHQAAGRRRAAKRSASLLFIPRNDLASFDPTV